MTVRHGARRGKLLFTACALCAAVRFAAPPQAAADTLRLKNGKVFEGILVEESSGDVVFDVIMGASRMRMSFRPEEVERVERASASERKSLKSEMLKQREEEERYAEKMRERGLILHRGEWITREELRRRENEALSSPRARRGSGTRRPVAPGFELEDLEGKVHSMYQYRGRPLLIFFFQTKSRPSASQVPTLKRTSEKYADEGLAVLGISLDADREKVGNFAVTRKIDFPILCDGKGWKSPVVKKYGVKRLPATYLVDRAGEVRATGILGEYVEKAVEKMLNQ